MWMVSLLASWVVRGLRLIRVAAKGVFLSKEEESWFRIGCVYAVVVLDIVVVC